MVSPIGLTIVATLVEKRLGKYLISVIPHFLLSLQWFPLQGGQGQVHLRLEWLSLLPSAEKLEQVTNLANRKLAGEKQMTGNMGNWRARV